jgi:hypothetical protein
MRKSIKRVTAVVSAMALTVASCMPIFAAETGSYTGTIAGDDLKKNYNLPTSGSLIIKPYTGTQISTGELYFENAETAAAAAGDDIVTYKVNIAGYSCSAVSANEDDPITVAASLPSDGSTAKVFTASIELGAKQTAKAADAKAFKALFATPAVKVAVSELVDAESLYNGTEDTTYIKATGTTAVEVGPQEFAPFRISGTMNTAANWQAGDTITIVPVYSVDIDVTQKS